MKATRRELLKTTGALGTLVSLGIITASEAQAAAAESRPGFVAKDLAGALQAIGGKGAESDKIKVNAPDIAENGAVVPVGAASEIAGTTDIWVLVEKNPNPLAAAFSLPAGTDADVDLRVKMGQTSDVYAVVKANGQLYYAKKETKVTLGGCGG